MCVFSTCPNIEFKIQMANSGNIDINNFSKIHDIITKEIVCNPDLMKECELIFCNTLTVVLDFDDTIASNPDTVKLMVGEIPSKFNTSLTYKKDDINLVVTDKNVVTTINSLKEKGATIVVCTSRGPQEESIIAAVLKHFKISYDRIICTNREPKGKIIHDNYPHLNGGMIIVVDDLDVNLKSFDNFYAPNRLRKILYHTYN